MMNWTLIRCCTWWAPCSNYILQALICPELNLIVISVRFQMFCICNFMVTKRRKNLSIRNVATSLSVVKWLPFFMSIRRWNSLSRTSLVLFYQPPSVRFSPFPFRILSFGSSKLFHFFKDLAIAVYNFLLINVPCHVRLQMRIFDSTLKFLWISNTF